MEEKKNLIDLAPGPNTLARSPNEKGKVAGFWRGLLHGSIAPITLIISLFNENVHMYEVHNNGGWYNFGYLLGLTSIFGGGRGGASLKRKQDWSHAPVRRGQIEAGRGHEL